MTRITVARQRRIRTGFPLIAERSTYNAASHFQVNIFRLSTSNQASHAASVHIPTRGLDVSIAVLWYKRWALSERLGNLE